MKEKVLVENSLKILNDRFITKTLFFSVRKSGKAPTWKTVFANNSSISEGFKTWREVRIFLSGIRTCAYHFSN